MEFLFNAWYVAAFSDEVEPGKPFARRLLDKPIVFFRDPEGRPVALDDRCPHRFAALSRGRLIDGTLECPYHGLRFGPSGRCTSNPHGDGHIPAGAAVASYPVREQYGAIWIWLGDGAQAANTPLPAFDFLDPVHNFTSNGYLHTRANYQLSVDNLLDLSHFQYLHPDTLGSDQIARGGVGFVNEGDMVWVHREAYHERLRPFVAQAFGVPEETRVHRSFDVRWHPPGLLAIVIGVVQPEASPDLAKRAPSAHWLTPETASTTHYFFAFGLPRAMGEDARVVVRLATEGLMQPFRDEDLPMLEAQQQVIGSADFWSLQPVMLPIDKGAVRARRIMERLIAAERAAVAVERGQEPGASAVRAHHEEAAAHAAPADACNTLEA
jgi:phenylpropionate dioxygenase-like ring-hydroxylating dioxygenase large terminal subunit